MNKKEIILVTGPSGVHIKDSLLRLNIDISENNIISVENKIEEISKLPFREFIGTIQYEQYKLWLRAFEEIINKEIPQKKSVEHLFITFHAVYYHQQKQEFFSPIDIKALMMLKNIRKVKMMIVFIDDVYDVYRRLMDEGEMYSDILNKDKTIPLKAIFASIFNIITLLNWREMELAFSKFIAKILDNIPLFVVSTKHPSFMVTRLMVKPLNKLNIYYLSHPITTIRQESIQYLPSFVGRLESIIQSIISDENTILFFPTSIDELIIEREKYNGKGYYYWPTLAQRWSHPYPEKDLLSPPLPNYLKKVNPLNPLKYKVSRRKNNRTSSAISQMLSLLWDFIYYKQVISRDYSLVEQSKDGIIVCRPLFNGVKSDGVLGEIEYNLRLMNNEKHRSKTRRKCLIITCDEDINKWIIYNFYEMLKREIKGNILKKIEYKLDELKGNWLDKSSEIVKKDWRIIKEEIERSVDRIEFDFKNHSPWKGDSMLRKAKGRNHVFNSCWEEAKKDIIREMINSIIDKDKIKDNVCYKLYNERKYWKNTINFIKSCVR